MTHITYRQEYRFYTEDVVRIAFKLVALLLLLALFAAPAMAVTRCLLHTAHACCESGGAPTVAPAPRACCQINGPASAPAPMMRAASNESPMPQMEIAITQAPAPTMPDIATELIGSSSNLSLAQLCVLLI